MNEFLQVLFHPGLYKRSQGRIARQATLGAVALLSAVGCYRLRALLDTQPVLVANGVPLVLMLAMWWTAFRLVHLPQFADFLIAVEAEMNKVSWPSRPELVRSSLVVLICLVALATLIAAYDAVWAGLFRVLRIVV